MCHLAQIDLPCRAESVALGRRFVAEVLLRWGVGEDDPARPVADDVLLVVSELLTNAQRAGSESMTLTIESQGRSVRVEVSDDSPTPAASHSIGEEALSGRGLRLVAAMTESWGQSEYDGATKSVWADTTVPADSDLDRNCRR